MTTVRFLYTMIAACVALTAAHGQEGTATVPFATGVVLAHTFHERNVERESVVRLDDVSPAGVRYQWSFVEVFGGRDTVHESHKRFVREADLDTSTRWHQYYAPKEPAEHPGYTAFSVSRAMYDRLIGGNATPFSVIGFSDDNDPNGLAAFGIGSAAPTIVRWRGTLSPASKAPESFPILLSGRRVVVPALRLKGHLTSRDQQWEPDIWILAQRDHPIFLKIVKASGAVFQVVRVDTPPSEGEGSLERKLLRSCRVEVPGIYFEFNSAMLSPESDNAIGALKNLFARHADWSATIEGHTDSIGTATSNQLLSERRAKTVRDRLVSGGIAATRLRAVGYGATHPLETNATIEGRARNRRVELVRPCGESK